MRNVATNNIGVVVGRITNPFYPELLDAVSASLQNEHKRMTLWTSDGSGEDAAVLEIRDRLVDGLIFTTANAQSTALKEALEREAPIVLLNRSLEGIPCDQLTSDNSSGTAAAARYLVELGHTNVAVLGGLQEISTGRERRIGFLNEMARLGYAVTPEHDKICDFTHEAGRQLSIELLSGPEPPTAIFCVNDLIAFGALDAARELGVPVPKQLSVIGYDDIDMAKWSVFNLTTVRQPTRAMAHSAVVMLLQRLADPNRPFEHRRYAADLIVRGSTAARSRSRSASGTR
jgi:LacI family transcriptional regulator